jgi:hypothetical protein
VIQRDTPLAIAGGLVRIVAVGSMSNKVDGSAARRAARAANCAGSYSGIGLATTLSGSNPAGCSTWQRSPQAGQ